MAEATPEPSAILSGAYGIKMTICFPCYLITALNRVLTSKWAVLVDFDSENFRLSCFCPIKNYFFTITQFLLLTFIKSAAYPAIFRHVTTEMGLSHHNIQFVFQDRKDFIWVGTSDGLNRLDGKTIIRYFHQGNSEKTLSSNNILGIAETPKGEILIATEEGLDSYSYLNNSFKRVFPGDSEKSADNLKTEYLLVDKRGHIWVVCGSEIFELDTNFQIVGKWGSKLFGAGPISSIQETNDHNILVSKGGWLNLIDPFKQRVANRNSNLQNLPFLKEKIKIISFSADGGFWELTFTNRLNHFDSFGKLILSRSISSDWFFTKLFISENNDLWICTLGKGLLKFQEKTGKFKQYSHVNHLPETICGNVVNGILEDNSGNIWVYTSQGLDVLKLPDPAVRVIRDLGREKYLPDMPVELSALQIEKEHLWIASWGNGIYHIDEVTGRKNLIRGGKTDIENMIWDLIPDGDGILFGSYGGLCRYSFSDKKIKAFRTLEHYPVKKDSIAVIRLFRDSRGLVWASFLGSNGIMQCNPSSMEFRWYNKHSKPVFLFPHFDAAAEDQRGNLWFGHKNQKGILIFQHREEEFRPLPHFHDYVNCLMADGESVWAGSKNGLFQLGGKGKIIRHFTRKDGLPNNQVNALVKDQNGKIWAGTDNGLFIVDSDFSVRTLQEFEFGTETEILAARFDSLSRRIFFVTPHSVFYFNPDSLRFRRVILKPGITRVLAAGLPLDFSSGDIPKIASNGGALSFEFDAPSFFRQGPVRFSWMLKGLDSKWSSESPGNVAIYSNLPPGIYEFCLRATLDGKKWFESADVIRFEAELPFFRQTWFFILMLVILFTVITLAIVLYYRIRLEKIRYGQLIRNKISEDIHDDISLGITRIVWQTEMLLGKIKNQKDVAPESLNNILYSARDTASKLSEIVWAVNPEHDNLDAFLSYLRNYAGSLMEELEMNYEIDFPEVIPDISLDSNLVRNLFLMAKESLNNAIRHSEAGKITITFNMPLPRQYQLSISDNGRGFDLNSNNSLGNGLINLKNRASKIKAEVTIASSPGKGCSIIISGLLFS